MTKVKEHIKVAELLVRKKLGMLTDEQMKDLQKWEAAEDHQKIEDDILNPRSYEEWTKQVDGVDVSVEWTMFRNRMQRTATREKVVRLNVIRMISAVAAVVFT